MRCAGSSASYWPDRVERITGVPDANSSRPRTRWAKRHRDGAHGRGPEQQSQGVNNVLAFINLVLALGRAAATAAMAA